MAIMSLIAVPFVLLPGLLLVPRSAIHSGLAGALPAVVIAIVFPVVYGVFGFIGGVLAAVVYNLVAKMTGGIEYATSELLQSV